MTSATTGAIVGAIAGTIPVATSEATDSIVAAVSCCCCSFRRSTSINLTAQTQARLAQAVWHVKAHKVRKAV